MSRFRFRATSVPVICPKRGVNMFVLTVFLPCQFKRGVHVFVLTVSTSSRLKSFDFLFNLSSLISRASLTFLCLPVHFACCHLWMQPTDLPWNSRVCSVAPERCYLSFKPSCWCSITRDNIFQRN